MRLCAKSLTSRSKLGASRGRCDTKQLHFAESAIIGRGSKAWSVTCWWFLWDRQSRAKLNAKGMKSCQLSFPPRSFRFEASEEIQLPGNLHKRRCLQSIECWSHSNFLECGQIACEKIATRSQQGHSNPHSFSLWVPYYFLIICVPFSFPISSQLFISLLVPNFVITSPFFGYYPLLWRFAPVS
jgi:hypothetical protein